MRKNIIHILTFVLLLLLSKPLCAQKVLEDQLFTSKTLIMLAPQYLVNKQIRIDVDEKIKRGHFLSFSPHYVRDDSRNQEGFGLGVTYKYFPSESSYMYFGGGLSATFCTFDTYAKNNEDLIFMYNSKVNQYGFNLVHGTYIRFMPHLYGDLYYGIGYRLSTAKSSDDINHEKEFQLNWFDYGYSGFMLVVGIRFGIML